MTDEASDFQACQMLTDNAENLTSAISEALHQTKSAGIRATKKEEVANGISAKPGTKLYIAHVKTHTYARTHTHTHTNTHTHSGTILHNNCRVP